MIPRLKDISELLEGIAPRRLAEKWDNVGLQVGSRNKEIRRILLALDPGLDALEAASNMGAQLLITHHPLIFSPLYNVDTESFPGEIIAAALEKGICVMAAHTNLDGAREGISEVLAELLDIKNLEIIEKSGDREDEGLGRIGTLDEKVPLFVFARNVAERLAVDTVKIVGEETAMVQKVAVLGGAGGGFVSKALSMSADVLVTGDLGYHHALEASRCGLAVVDAGHFHTEKAALRIVAGRFQSVIKSMGWAVDVEFYEGQKPPFLYFSTGIPRR
ncbi:MAG: Nif3-like dinuclear metal center hexameric protein [Desulfobacteraceae bacterium]|jgi:dinuclear metal center YbgI/SA1388 family protein|nr:MAG: Nif3-like dinuclear metal center hexameric protein [Desulfobacteraceae bacterium]